MFKSSAWEWKMPFIVRWTDQNGSHKLEVPTGRDAYKKWAELRDDPRYLEVEIHDDSGKRMTEFDILTLGQPE
jgi:hypothetical protein